VEFFAGIVNRTLFKVTKFNNTCKRNTDLDRTLLCGLRNWIVAKIGRLRLCSCSVCAGIITAVLGETMEIMELLKLPILAALLSSVLALSACSGSGSDEPAPPVTPTNSQPMADAGVDQDVDELTAVMLDGSLSADPDTGDVLTYTWAQTAGTSVTLSALDVSQPTFDAPDVTAINTPDSLTFELTVSDGSASHSDSVVITVNNIGLGINTPPSADAGADQTVAMNSAVSLDGSASDDPDGDPLSYAWLQTGGPNVGLSAANVAQPAFTSPVVAPNATETLSFQLTVDDGTDSAVDRVDILVQEGLSQVNVSGVVSYEWVPTNDNGSTCSGLNFAGTTVQPIRAATVQLLDADNNVLGTMASGENGSYSFANIDANTDVRIRVRAELLRTGAAPTWDVQVRDNVDISASPPPLQDRPLYVAQWPLFNTGVTHITDADFTATTGWGGASYTGTRAAAPFAILDNIYTGMQFVLGADPAAIFSPLEAYWSVNNTRTEGSPTDIDLGELGGSFYIGGANDGLFIMGDADVNTGEFDNYVTLHEWGHYFEDNFSRSDSVGGSHSVPGTVEARVAFGEGWGTGIGAMASGSPMACNTGAANGAGSWGFNVETDNRGHQGWYNEISVAALLLDLFDNNDDGVDNSSIGFGPIYDVMINQQRTTEAFTTLFSFATLLRPDLTAPQQGFLDALLAAENIETTGLDIWATEQANIDVFPNNARDVLPLYIDYAADGSTLMNVCTNNDHDPDGDGNKPAEYRYLRITTSSSAAYDVTVVPNPVPPPTADPAPTPPDVIRDRSDPDIFVYRDGELVAFGFSGVDDLEEFTTQVLPADVYVADLEEWRYEDPDASSDFPDQVCFDVTMTAQ
jgi:hypothetical protein